MLYLATDARVRSRAGDGSGGVASTLGLSCPSSGYSTFFFLSGKNETLKRREKKPIPRGRRDDTLERERRGTTRTRWCRRQSDGEISRACASMTRHRVRACVHPAARSSAPSGFFFLFFSGLCREGPALRVWWGWGGGGCVVARGLGGVGVLLIIAVPSPRVRCSERSCRRLFV